MNIFVLDLDPRICAEYHLDKHAVKMCLEYSQLLCSAHHMAESNYIPPYGLSHKNHPCSIWVRECIENYIWLCELGLELCQEYQHRYNKRHKCQDIIEWAITHKPNLKENGAMTKFALAMPDECKEKSEVQSYRNYYITHKRRMASWKKREAPSWFI